MRSMSGSPSMMARLMAKTVATLSTMMPMSTARPPLGTWRPVSSSMVCLAPPEGYLVGTDLTSTSASLAWRVRASMAAGLLSSTPIRVSLGLSRCLSTRMPSMISSAYSCINLSSVVM